MFDVLKFKRTRIVAMLLAALMVAPLAATLSPAEAKPPRHAPAWGYRRKEHKEWRRTTRRNDWRRDTRRTPYRHSWDRDRTTWRRTPRRTDWRNDWDRNRTTWRRERRSVTYLPTNRTRYRLQYRTRYNRYGQPYRVWTRVSY